MNLLGSGLFFAVISSLFAWPIASRLRLSPSEKISASTALSLTGIFLVAWLVYVWQLPTVVFWIIPAATLIGLLLDHRSLAQSLENAAARQLAGLQGMVSAWCILWLGLVVDYSGGKWVGDWFGHWQRALFFLHHWPQDILFNGFDPLPSRPPLANIVYGAFLRLTRIDFAHYQLYSTIFASLAFTPAALIARHLCRSQNSEKVAAVLALLFMLSPMFVQNATFAWTKLPAAFFVLTATYFFFRTQESDGPGSGAALFGVSLAAGLLTHYSAGPYVVLFAAGWILPGWSGIKTRRWCRSTLQAVATGGAFLATWFGWALMVYGKGTFFSNTTVTDQAPTFIAQVQVIALNLRDSIVPHFLGGADFSAFAQTSPWGWWRDWFFQLYQCNVLFTFGSTGWIVAAYSFFRYWRRMDHGPGRAFSIVGAIALIILGIAVHGGREAGGVAHICLQPFTLFGLALIAATWAELSPLWKRLAVAGATIDLMSGIVLQFATESHFLDHWLAPGRSPGSVATSYSLFSQINARVKPDAGWIFLGDHLAPIAVWVAVLLGIVLTVVLVSTVKQKPGATSAADG